MPDAEPLSPPSLRTSLRFGPEGRFELQSVERRLLIDGHAAPLRARALDLLITLAAEPGHLITKSDLLERVWPGLVVEEGNLHTQMSSLRKLVGNDVIATVPGRGYRFAAQALAPAASAADGAPAAMATSTPRAPTPATPAATPSAPAIGSRLIGRELDLSRLERALASTGCVTLVGAGGVGKTRLALAAAARWTGRSVWVDLAPLTQGGQIAGALARALGLSLADGDAGAQLVRAIGDEPLLLVLDNAEHLVEPSSALAASLLASAPRLHLLVTSQLPLGLAAEQVLRLEPLAIEGEGGATATDGAIALLIERIAAADHRVRLDAGSTPLLREICRQLDGLPLALEMAAARVPLLGLKGVRDELSQRFALLTKGHRQAAQRHRTLHAALDWSHALLGAEEQRLFAALGVFAGGFPLELCVALASDDEAARWEVIDRLAVLVDRSLVAASSDDPPRYRLLETMRAYALEKLRENGDEALQRQRHADVVLAHFRRHTVDLRDHPRCVPELDNAREANAWLLACRPLPAETVVELTRLANVPSTFTPWRGETHAWMLALEPWMASAEAETVDLPRRLHWWTEYTRASVNAMSPRAFEIAEQTVALARLNGEPWPLCAALGAALRVTRQADAVFDARALEVGELLQAHPEWSARQRLTIQGALAVVAEMRDDREGRLAARSAEVRIAREAGNFAAADAAETNVVMSLYVLGRHEEAAALAAALTERLDGQRTANLLWAWYGRVSALLALHRLEDVRRHLPRLASLCRDFDSPLAAPGLVELAWQEQRHEAAARLIGHLRQSFGRRGMSTAGSTDKLMARIGAGLLPLLPAGRFEALVEEGRGLSEQDALELIGGA